MDDIQKIEDNHGQIAQNVAGDLVFYQHNHYSDKNEKRIPFVLDIKRIYIIEFEDIEDVNNKIDSKHEYILRNTIGTGVEYFLFRNEEEIKNLFFEILAESRINQDTVFNITTSKYNTLLKQYNNTTGKAKLKLSYSLENEIRKIEKLNLLTQLLHIGIILREYDITADKFMSVMLKLYNQDSLLDDFELFFKKAKLKNIYWSSQIVLGTKHELPSFQEIYLTKNEFQKIENDKTIKQYGKNIQIEVLCTLINLFVSKRLHVKEINLKLFFTGFDKILQIENEKRLDASWVHVKPDN